MRTSIEPGLLRIFRYFSNVAVAYFAILWGYAIITTGWDWSLQLQMTVNLLVYMGLVLYLSWPRLEARLKRYYLPIGLAIVTIIPVMSNVFYLLDLNQVNTNLIISRSWLWLPVLLIPVVLIAWQYSLKPVIIYTIFTNGLELIVLLAVVEEISIETLPLLGVPLIRSFAFGIVGNIVYNLIDTQRSQRHKLIQTNIQMGQYSNTLERLATSRERNRLAGEMHDILAHTLSGLAVNLEAIKTLLKPDQGEVSTLLDHSLRTTRQGLDDTRRALKALRAQPLDDLGLLTALRNLTETAAIRAGIPISFTAPSVVPALTSDVEQNIFRITQEALENIVRHANATTASVKLSVSINQVELLITDDGAGFDSSAPAHKERFGLHGMMQRAASVGADLEVESKPGMGTRIQFIWERYIDQNSDL